MKNFLRFQFSGLSLRTLGLAGLLALAFFAAACDNDSGSNNPLGPSATAASLNTITVTPLTASIDKAGTVTFVAAGGSKTFSWSVSDTSLGTIVSATGVFTAGTTVGTLTVTATDTNGLTGTATVSVVSETLVVSPDAASINLGETVTFTSTGVAPFFWTLSNISVGNIGSTTGIFVADGTAGTATVNVVDSEGNTGTGSITAFTDNIVINPKDLTLDQLPAATIAFTATGNVGTVFWSMTGQSATFTGATINTSTGVVTVTVMPTVAEGTQTLTLRATDGTVGDGSATLTLNTV